MEEHVQRASLSDVSSPRTEYEIETFHKSSTSTLPTAATSPSPHPSDDRSKLTNKESFKVRKRTYKKEKKKKEKEFSSAIKDKSVTIVSSWLKIRGTLKSWSKYWCVVKPEVIIVYKSDSQHHWVGTILINNCEFIERPSSKEGFCFKIFQPYGQSIWATKGPKGEVAGSLVQPMPKDHLIFRAANEEIGRCWLDALEVAQSTSLISSSDKIQSDLYGSQHKDTSMAENIYDDGFIGDKSDYSSGEDPPEEEAYGAFTCTDEPVEETSYVAPVEHEEFGEAGETSEEMEEENKSILWALLKQVRPGMDLSKVTLPTFILEPRSFLDKLSDYYYHSDYLATTAMEENPYLRMKEVVKWYLSGFYKKPKGLKKPYNPIIGEMFRCHWPNERNGSRTFFIAEQVSHHPPVSAFYCSNRKDGYAIGGSILAKSKFYGNSSSAILDGTATITLLKLGEDYTVNMPYAHVKGILIGSLTAEYGGVVHIKCEKTGYRADIEFKLKPFWKKSGECNYIAGKIRMGNDVLSKIEGRWDGEIFITEYIKDNQTVEDPIPEVYFSPTPEVKRSRLKRHTVKDDAQEEYESERLWSQVSIAIKEADQTAATREKLVLEDAQRRLHKELKEKDEQWTPRYFERDPDSTNTHAWIYKYKDLRAWDTGADLMQYEYKGVIKTQTRHKVPLVKRTTSIANILTNTTPEKVKRLSSIREPNSESGSRKNSYDRASNYSTRSEDDAFTGIGKMKRVSIEDTLKTCLKPLVDSNIETKKQLTALRAELRRFRESMSDAGILSFRDVVLVIVVIFVQLLLQWWWKR